jgi:quinolinate synthase
MKLTSLIDVYETLNGIKNNTDDAFEIIMTPEEIKASRRCIDEMIRLGG